MTNPEFKPVALFGGAITVELPSTFEDVSEIRQVPDNQEVYLDHAGFTSVVVEILERVEAPAAKTDDEALRYHLSDIVGEDDQRELKVWNTGEMNVRRIPQEKLSASLALLATSPPGEKQRGRPNEPDFVGILLTLIRLDKKLKTDIIITVNVPHVIAAEGEQQSGGGGSGGYVRGKVDIGNGKLGKLLEMGSKIRERVLETFEIRDWGLFVNDEDDSEEERMEE